MMKPLSRRTVLRGAGAAVALPLLDAMVPTLGAAARTAASPVRRFAAVYAPMGMYMKKWTPPALGPLQPSPILQPAAPFKDRLLVLSGIDVVQNNSLDGGGVHSRLQPAWLTGMHSRRTEGADLQVGVSMDQIAAQQLGRETQLASLEIGLETGELAGVCDIGYTCAYTATLSWRTPSTPQPMENNPRSLFERLFGGSDSTDARARLADLAQDRSILDVVRQKAAQLQQQLGPRDRVKLAEYLDAVRDIERRIQKAEEQSSRELPVVEQPVGVPQSYEEYAKLMFDLLALAFQCDLTRISTFMLGRELSARTFPEIGVPDQHHGLSHHQENVEKLEKQARVNIFHMKLFSYFLEKLQSIPDGDGSLLDHSMLLYGSAMSNSNNHVPYDVPTMVVGGPLFDIRGGRHVQCPAGTPLTNLHLSLLDRIGVRIDRLGDSNGRLTLLAV